MSLSFGVLKRCRFPARPRQAAHVLVWCPFPFSHPLTYGRLFHFVQRGVSQGECLSCPGVSPTKQRPKNAAPAAQRHALTASEVLSGLPPFGKDIIRVYGCAARPSLRTPPHHCSTVRCSALLRCHVSWHVTPWGPVLSSCTFSCHFVH